MEPYCLDPAIVVILLGLWPRWHPQLLMLQYEYTQYSPFNKRLLPVTHVITLVSVIACILSSQMCLKFSAPAEYQSAVLSKFLSIQNVLFCGKKFLVLNSKAEFGSALGFVLLYA